MANNQAVEAPVRERVKTISLVVANLPTNIEQPPDNVVCLMCPAAIWRHDNVIVYNFCEALDHYDISPQRWMYDCDKYRAMTSEPPEPSGPPPS